MFVLWRSIRSPSHLGRAPRRAITPSRGLHNPYSSSRISRSKMRKSVVCKGCIVIFMIMLGISKGPGVHICSLLSFPYLYRMRRRGPGPPTSSELAENWTEKIHLAPIQRYLYIHRRYSDFRVLRGSTYHTFVPSSNL